jgi:hypothetical protein
MSEGNWSIDGKEFKVLVNDEEQHSLWPSAQPGQRDGGKLDQSPEQNALPISRKIGQICARKACTIKWPPTGQRQ